MKTVQILLLIFILSGCTNDNDLGGLETTIILKVEDEFSGEVLPNKRFEFIDCSSEVFTIKDECFNTELMISNNSGRDTLVFTNEVNRTYQLKYRPSDWTISDYQSTIYYEINEGSTNNITFKLKPVAQLGIHFKHDGSEGFSKLGYSINRTSNTNGNSDWDGFQGTGFGDLSMPIDTIIYRPLMQNENYILDASITKSNNEIIKDELVIEIPKTDTVVVEFNF